MRTQIQAQEVQTTDRDWTYVNTSSLTELCHIGIRCRLVVLKPIQI